VPTQEPQTEQETRLRSRKKEKTRLAIHDAALELFIKQGFDATTVEQIAAQADVSTATFFRYFATKSEVIFSGHGYELPALYDAILGRPKDEDGLLAVRNAIREWVPLLDTERVVHQLRVASSSARLVGFSIHLGMKWQSIISDALAERRGLRGPDTQSRLTAALAMAVFGNAANAWEQRGCRGQLGTAVERGFEEMLRLAEQAAVPRQRARSRQAPRPRTGPHR
jgi:AcrR family transcriptional regulator